MAFRGVFFDAADTLFHTRGTVGQIYAAVAREYGSPVSDQVIHESFLRQFRHSGPLSTTTEKEWWKGVVHRVFSEVGMVRDFDQFFEKVYDKFRDRGGWTLFPETTEVLQQLQTRKFKLGVISNFDSRVYSVMQSLDILHFFDAVTISSETGFAKPDPRIFEAATRALAIPPDEAVVVGDSLHDDIEAGTRAGLTAILLDREDRHASVAGVKRIRSLTEILAFLQ
jgi:putative hydrolase of the HAD superfamily